MESVISRFTERPWPAISPDLSPLDYVFWSVCLVELRKNPPNSFLKLLNTVERYTVSLNKDQIITAVNDIILIDQACMESDGGAFEYKIKSLQKNVIVNLFL